MNVILNGKKKNLQTEISLQDLTEEASKDPQCLIAEINGQIIKRPSWGETKLRDGDTIELVAFVGGG